MTSKLFGQSFVNFDFESATPNLIDPLFGQADFQLAEDILPGWEAFSDGIKLNELYYNSCHIGSEPAIFSVISDFHGSYVTNHCYGSPLSGDYSLVIENRGPTADLTQTGFIPLSSKSLLINGFFRYGSRELFKVFVDGNELELFTRRDGDSFIIIGAVLPNTVSGTVAELNFHIAAPGGVLYIDDIAFSTTLIPEPSHYVLTLGLLLCLIVWRKRANQSLLDNA